MFAFVPYSLLVFVHIAAALELVGHSLWSPLVHTMIRDARTVPVLRTWLEFARRSARWNPAAALVLLGSGVWLGSAGWWRQPWFFVAVAAWAANGLLATRVVRPAAAALGGAVAQAGDGPITGTIDRLRRARGWVAVRVMLANDLAILYVMIDKPSLARALTLIALAQAAAAVAAVPARLRADTTAPARPGDVPAVLTGSGASALR